MRQRQKGKGSIICKNLCSYFVLNVSCPNVSNFTKLQDVAFLETLIPKLKEINSKKTKTKSQSITSIISYFFKISGWSVCCGGEGDVFCWFFLLGLRKKKKRRLHKRSPIFLCQRFRLVRMEKQKNGLRFASQEREK